MVKNYVYSRLDGATKIEDRPKLVHTFNSDCSQFVFLISKKYVPNLFCLLHFSLVSKHLFTVVVAD